MPELPDVETFKHYIDSTSLHKTIEKAQVMNKKILEEISKNNLEQVLQGTRFVESDRHGKYLYLKTTENQWMVVHFGMTGFVKYFKDESDKPNHTRLLLRFDNNYFFFCLSTNAWKNWIDSKQRRLHRKKRNGR